MDDLLLSILLIFHLGVCLLLIVAVLMQRSRSEGLGTAFGSKVADNIFGAQTSSVLARVTTYLGIIFFVLTLLLTILYARTSTAPSPVRKALDKLSSSSTNSFRLLGSYPAAIYSVGGGGVSFLLNEKSRLA